MLDFIAERGLKPHIDQVFALGDIHSALDRLSFGSVSCCLCSSELMS
jgi:D-arabinose 1-dehydrogenase-like Zn-dependent alcohol dehydrogenase